jgi:FkbM family methyltransferase
LELICLIEEHNSILNRIVEELRESELPLVLYGAGDVAGYIYDFLYENKIYISDVAIDEKYISGRNVFKNKEIVSIESITSKYACTNIFVAFNASGIRNKQEIVARTGINVNKAYWYDIGCTHYGVQSIDYNYVLKNYEQFKWVYNNLYDDLSKKTLIAFINQRISGKYGYLEEVYNKNRYFPNDIISIGPDEVYVDCGAYDGDTIELFLKKYEHIDGDKYESIYALEPNETNYKKLKERYKHHSNIFVINKGVWHEKAILAFENKNNLTSRISEYGTQKVHTESIDNILHGKKATYIKMDIEGAELNALQGAKNTIRNFSPKLAVCIYHKKDDLITIPRYIRELKQEYRLFLRAHAYGSNDVVLYAII